MSKIILNGKWDAVGTAPNGTNIEFLGNVPGSALNDIINHKKISKSEVLWRDNAENYQEYENYDWKYTKNFTLDESITKAELVFEKLDTFCDVYLNGKHLGYCDNGFISHSFVVCDIPKGENTIEIYFYSPIFAVRGRKKRRGAFTTVDRLYARRTQCSYGWDWAMRFVTCGISGDVYLNVLSDSIKVKTAYVYTKSIDNSAGAIGIDVYTVDYERGAILDFEIYDSDGTVVRSVSKYVEEEFLRLDLDIENPKLWYPLGYGEQNLYRLVIKSVCGKLYETSFGIRTARILEIPDKVGSENYDKCIELKKSSFSQQYDQNTEFSCFILTVNGKKIMCKGANWVPCEPFCDGDASLKITQTLEMAAKMGVNMIRIWGGGQFESEHFYDECSRLGIMVTQDFLMACGQYPDDEQWFLEHLKKEAEYIVLKIRNKPCLMWWTGDNENAVWGCDTDLDYTGRKAAYKAIGPVLYNLDPHRRFLPSSPYGGEKYASNTKGTTHNTQFMGALLDYIMDSDVKDYKDFFKIYNARFIAEEPCLGAIDEESLKNFMTEEDIYAESLVMWKYHTKSNPPLRHELFDYIYTFARKLLGDFVNGEDRLFKLQYLQYEWVRVSMERVRREKWFCSGVIYWMLNDNWPASSGWALIDYYGRAKSAYYSFKRLAKPVVLSLDLMDDKYRLYVSNDGNSEALKLKWYVVSFDGKTVKESEETEFFAEENSASLAMEFDASLISDNCFVVAKAFCENTEIDRTFYKKGNLELVKSNADIKITIKDENVLELKSDVYVHALKLSGDAEFEDNWFSLMPGEIKEVRVTDGDIHGVKANAYTFKQL